MSSVKKTDWVVLGRVVGKATGWDQADTNVIQLYDFEPAATVPMSATGCLVVDFENGLFEGMTDEGTVTFSLDILSVLASAQKPAV